jgi:hypothetical protein
MKRVVTYGLEAAVDHAISYLKRYLLLGLVPLWLITREFDWPGLTVWVAVLQLVSALLLFPGALLINRIALRFFRRRTWDLQPWRPWLASILAVGLIWGAMFETDLFRHPPALLTNTLGEGLAGLLHGIGLIILASSIALTVAWALPPSHVRKMRGYLLR